MGTRKSQLEVSETLNSVGQGQEDEETRVGGGFFACYLLTSLSPRHKGHTYIGFTVNPRRRIRQHNGEIRCGAWRTKRKRPWEMVLCIYGFPTNVSALQFEWAWQHPRESLAARKAAATLKSLSGLANKIKLVYTMLTLPAWQNLHLTVNFLSTKYTKYSAGCPSLPEHMRVQVCSMDELPCYTGSLHEDEDEDGWGDKSSSPCGSPTDRVDGQRDRLTSIKELSTADHSGRAEDTGTGLSGDLASSNKNQMQPLSLSTSPVQLSTSGLTYTGRDVSVLMEEQPAGEELSAVRAADTDPPPKVPCEVEVIDLLSPSPGYRTTGSSSKKRKVWNACPEIIDLTESPISV
ncbi:uncharacterized protein LOC127798127 [Diospyros lotus]|uniref:uncharacterized protein LOC127798127 n=1 Tax=Diospyros lotus TaxID=55363 RepID=UPI002255787E|nr:uncharacterized protein LOC127798127 [Diospyros lotus]